MRRLFIFQEQRIMLGINFILWYFFNVWKNSSGDSFNYSWFLLQAEELTDKYICLLISRQKILSTPSLGGEVKPSVPCRRFATCKRSLELRGRRILDEICRNISRLRRVPPSPARGLSLRWTWMNLAEKVGTSKRRGKAMATYP